jgi:putative spermidine/putrescine transport system substrate-binding protein
MTMATTLGFGRRKFAAGAAAGTTFPYFFVKAHAQTDPKRLVIYTWDGALGRFYDEHWIGPFMKQFDVKVETIPMVGASVQLDRVRAQIGAGRPESDLLPLHPHQRIFAERNNMMLKIERSALPEAVNYDPDFITDNGPRLVIWCYGLCYNTEKISQAPTKWRDLWDPRFKGKAAINEALLEQTVQMVNLAFNGRTTPIGDDVFQRLSELRPSLVALWNNAAQAEQSLRTGEYWITPFWNGRVYKLAEGGAPLEFVVPEEGMFVRASLYAMPRNPTNPELMYKYLNFIMGAERQQKLAELFYYGSGHRQVKYAGDLARKVVTGIPDLMKRAKSEDFAAILDQQAEWTRLWNRWKTT